MKEEKVAVSPVLAGMDNITPPALLQRCCESIWAGILDKPFSQLAPLGGVAVHCTLVQACQST